MGRAAWIGELSFGRVRIPVRLETIVQDKSVRGHLVHREDKGRLEMKRFCRKCGDEIAWGDAARAIEVGDHEVVDVEPEELAALGSQREDEIALLGFTDPSNVDPVYYDRTYAVVPLGKQPRAFEVLAAVMRQTGKIPVTRVVLGKTSHPAILRARDGEIVLETLHYGDEVAAPGRKPDPQLRPSPRELDLGTRLVEKMSTDFDPTTTEDPYRAAVEQLAAGREVRPIDEAAARRKELEGDAEVLDLTSALEKSLGEKPHRGERRVPRAARTVRRPAAETRPAGGRRRPRAT